MPPTEATSLVETRGTQVPHLFTGFEDRAWETRPVKIRLLFPITGLPFLGKEKFYAFVFGEKIA